MRALIFVALLTGCGSDVLFFGFEPLPLAMGFTATSQCGPDDDGWQGMLADATCQPLMAGARGVKLEIQREGEKSTFACQMTLLFSNDCDDTALVLMSAQVGLTIYDEDTPLSVPADAWFLPDDDGDTWSNYQERLQNTDPRDPSSFPQESP